MVGTMTIRWFMAALLAFSASASVPGGLGGCTDGITCRDVAANGLIFQCRMAVPTTSAPPNAPPRYTVIMAHGFPEWSAMYMVLMRRLAAVGYPSIACNLRGYSPQARPEGKHNYFYDHFVDDIYAIADEVNSEMFNTDFFHMVGHDHGALLAWRVATRDNISPRVLSLTALSVPHPEAFRAGLIGPTADERQQIASQYFSIFILPDSASLHDAFLYNSFGKYSNSSDTPSFSSPEDFQKALWWYNGAQDAGLMTIPPSFTAEELYEKGAFSAALMREIFGGGGAPAIDGDRVTPAVTVPTLFVCGNQDTALLCTLPYAKATKDYVLESVFYRYVEIDCGHGVLSCDEPSQTRVTEDAIIALIQNVTSASEH